MIYFIIYDLENDLVLNNTFILKNNIKYLILIIIKSSIKI